MPAGWSGLTSTRWSRVVPLACLKASTTQHANLSGAERFQPAVNQELTLHFHGRDFTRLRYDGSCGSHFELISGGHILSCFRGGLERVYELGNPRVQLAFRWIVSQGLND